MNLYLLENYSTRLPFQKGTFRINTANGTASVFLIDKEMSQNGKGKLEEGRFPWKAYQVPESPGVLGFKLDISFVVIKSIMDTKGKSTPAILETEVRGDIAEMLQYVFASLVSHQDLNLKVTASINVLDKNTIYIQHEMRAFLQENGGIKFVASGNIDASAASIMYFSATGGFINPTEYSTKLTMELVKQTSMTPSLSATPNALQELNESIFNNKIQSDFVLVAENGFEMPCHKAFLEAHCPAFKNMFKNNTNHVQQSRHPLSLSEEGLKALLDFVYCLKLDIPKENPGVALALMEIGIKIQMPMLTKEMNDLLVEQPDDWFQFDAALQMFLHSTKMQGYEKLKNKAIRAMKLKRDDMESSEPCQQLLRTDPKSTMILLKALSCACHKACSS